MEIQCQNTTKLGWAFNFPYTFNKTQNRDKCALRGSDRMVVFKCFVLDWIGSAKPKLIDLASLILARESGTFSRVYCSRMQSRDSAQHNFGWPQRRSTSDTDYFYFLPELSMSVLNFQHVQIIRIFCHFPIHQIRTNLMSSKLRRRVIEHLNEKKWNRNDDIATLEWTCLRNRLGSLFFSFSFSGFVFCSPNTYLFSIFVS